MIRFILKGLIRDRSRSLFPVLTVAAGTFLVVFLFCWIEGVMSDLVSSSAKFSTGHVKVMTRAYEKLSSQIPNDLAILEVSKLLETLKKEEKKMVWTPRIRFGGILDIPDEKGETRTQGPVMGMGVDLLSSSSPETDILNLKKALIEGSLPKKRNEILISDEFAKKLNISIGDTATLLSSTMNGGMAMHNFTVSGKVRFGMVAIDRGAVIADIADVRIALDMPDGAGEIVGYSKDMLYYDENMLSITKEFNHKYSRPDDEFSPVMRALGEQEGLYEIIKRGDVIAQTILIIFIITMSIVLWNSGLMNSLRRYGEIGLRLAIGEEKGRLYRWMVYESVATGITGTVIGTALGIMVSYYLEVKGLDFSSIMKGSTVLMNNVMRARVTATSYIIGFIPGILAPVIGSIFAGIGIYKRQTSQLTKELET